MFLFLTLPTFCKYNILHIILCYTSRARFDTVLLFRQTCIPSFHMFSLVPDCADSFPRGWIDPNCQFLFDLWPVEGVVNSPDSHCIRAAAELKQHITWCTTYATLWQQPHRHKMRMVCVYESHTTHKKWKTHRFYRETMLHAAGIKSQGALGSNDVTVTFAWSAGRPILPVWSSQINSATDSDHSRFHSMGRSQLMNFKLYEETMNHREWLQTTCSFLHTYII